MHAWSASIKDLLKSVRNPKCQLFSRRLRIRTLKFREYLDICGYPSIQWLQISSHFPAIIDIILLCCRGSTLIGPNELKTSTFDQMTSWSADFLNLVNIFAYLFIRPYFELKTAVKFQFKAQHGCRILCIN